MAQADFSFADLTLTALGSGALWCAARSMLCVSDLHLGKSERMARRGGALLPPYETLATLDRLQDEIERHAPETVICLGDSFDDMAAVQALDNTSRTKISALMDGRRWVWIEGNHDPAATDLGGENLFELQIGTAWFRHIADPNSTTPEVSGHYHPKASLKLRGRRMTSACFAMDEHRLILPAFGTYTGGLHVTDPALRGLLQPNATVRMTRAPQHAIPIDALSG
ncbi:putative phosphoesterase [Monaibacterium marinum]|uniref:Putative phosphoesterase n=1 Tax=Pontivivens marinum TaxID=1690039 RepID=A0A2C9CNW2_9RHOB|nr:ligase-associated DNA damage response endonuclease PdeM [Monaibacterium marinum]SOH93014.1 putative phosphoesterase [Monaibacterium marinum]